MNSLLPSFPACIPLSPREVGLSLCLYPDLLLRAFPPPAAAWTLGPVPSGSVRDPAPKGKPHVTLPNLCLSPEESALSYRYSIWLSNPCPHGSESDPCWLEFALAAQSISLPFWLRGTLLCGLGVWLSVGTKSFCHNHGWQRVRDSCPPFLVA